MGEYNHLHSTSNFGEPSPCPLNFPVMPAGLPVEVIAKVTSRYYRVPRYFFTVLTVAHNRWYRPTLVEWSWLDSSLIWKTNWLPSVLWHCWFGHMICKNRPGMTYNMFGGTLNLAQSINLILFEFARRSKPAGLIGTKWYQYYKLVILRRCGSVFDWQAWLTVTETRRRNNK